MRLETHNYFYINNLNAKKVIGTKFLNNQRIGVEQSPHITNVNAACQLNGGRSVSDFSSM